MNMVHGVYLGLVVLLSISKLMANKETYILTEEEIRSQINEEVLADILYGDHTASPWYYYDHYENKHPLYDDDIYPDDMDNTEITLRMFINTVSRHQAINKELNISQFTAHCKNISKTIEFRDQEAIAHGLENLTCSKPPFCLNNECLCESLWSCYSCSKIGSIMFMVAITILAISITTLNSLIILVYLRSNHFKVPMCAFRTSLAVADLMCGLLLFAVIPNTIQALTNSNFVLVHMTKEIKNSPLGIISGSLIILSLTSSVHHLMIMSIERFLAINNPLTIGKNMGKRSKVMVAFVWMWSLVITATPVWFPSHFVYSFQPSLLLYTPVVLPESGDIMHGIILLVFALVIPYIITLTVTLFTTAKVFFSIKRNKKLTARKQTRYISKTNNNKGMQRQNKLSKKKLKVELLVLKTTVVMVFGFSLTLLPVIIYVGIHLSSNIDCETSSLVYTIVFYASMTNSLVNFIIYSARDTHFVKLLRKLLRLPVAKKKRREWNSTKSSPKSLHQFSTSQTAL